MMCLSATLSFRKVKLCNKGVKLTLNTLLVENVLDTEDAQEETASKKKLPIKGRKIFETIKIFEPNTTFLLY